jgi:flagellar hook assembly protein FlgD
VDITTRIQTGPNVIEGRTGQVATYLVAQVVGNQTGIGDGPGVAELRLHHAFPNPFRQSTRVEYDLPEGGRTRVTIYDVSGRPVRTLQASEYRAAGSYTLVWNGTDDGGRRVSPGIYFTRLETPDAVRTQRIVLTD